MLSLFWRFVLHFAAVLSGHIGLAPLGMVEVVGDPMEMASAVHSAE